MAANTSPMIDLTAIAEHLPEPYTSVGQTSGLAENNNNNNNLRSVGETERHLAELLNVPPPPPYPETFVISPTGIVSPTNQQQQGNKIIFEKDSGNIHIIIRWEVQSLWNSYTEFDQKMSDISTKCV